LRFTRDKRGYENTYVVHAERRRGRSRTRILYWFRTPPGVKVGRSALDDEALRRIERQNPELEFDWPRILKGGGAPPTEPRPLPEPRRFDKNLRSGVRPQSRAAEPAPTNGGLTPLEPPAPPEEAVKGNELAPTPEEWGQTPELAPDERGLTPLEGLPSEGTPAHEKLGQDGVQRLRQRYADVRARVFERATEPARRAELLATAERLNPDAWTTVDEVTSALEQYESVLAQLREVVGRKRRRRKRGGRRTDGTGPQPTSPHADAAADGPDDDPGDTGDDEDGNDEDPGSGNPASGNQ
jgi:hypothetical protein